MLLIIASKYIILTTSLKCRQTGEDGPQKNSNCVFPFKHQGKEYNECTDVNDDNKKLWCSTQVNAAGEHVRGNWGYCPNGKLI